MQTFLEVSVCYLTVNDRKEWRLRVVHSRAAPELGTEAVIGSFVDRTICDGPICEHEVIAQVARMMRIPENNIRVDQE